MLKNCNLQQTFRKISSPITFTDPKNFLEKVVVQIGQDLNKEGIDFNFIKFQVLSFKVITYQAPKSYGI